MKEIFKNSDLPCDLKVVRDGESAISFLKQQAPHQDESTPYLVILDINMPKMDGLQVLECIKNNAAISKIPVFMLTSSSLDNEIETAKTLGANGFIVKGSDFAIQNLIDYAGIAKYQPSTWIKIGTK